VIPSGLLKGIFIWANLVIWDFLGALKFSQFEPFLKKFPMKNPLYRSKL